MIIELEVRTVVISLTKGSLRQRGICLLPQLRHFMMQPVYAHSSSRQHVLLMLTCGMPVDEHEYADMSHVASHVSNASSMVAHGGGCGPCA
jgi:hypothetical protein